MKPKPTTSVCQDGTSSLINENNKNVESIKTRSHKNAMKCIECKQIDKIDTTMSYI